MTGVRDDLRTERLMVAVDDLQRSNPCVVKSRGIRKERKGTAIRASKSRSVLIQREIHHVYRHEPRSHDMIERKSDTDKNNQSRRHCRQHFTNDDARSNAQREGKDGVGDWYHVSQVERPVGVHGGGVDATGPPRDQQTQKAREHGARQTDDDQFGGDPASSRDALGPHQAVGTAFEFSGNERCPPKNSNDAGNDENENPQPRV